MEGELPKVPRFNKWREWKPIVANCSLEEYNRITAESRGLPLGNVRAVRLYCAFTHCLGIEFVVVSSAHDDTPYRRLNNGIILVPCAANPVQAYVIYDGWIPIADTDTATIENALQAVDEVVSYTSFFFDSSARWFVKYSETVEAPTSVAVGEDDHQALLEATHLLHQLPSSVQDAVIRAVHWRQHASIQLRPTDRLIALWQALESLLLSAHLEASDLELNLPGYASLPKPQRRSARLAEIKRILEDEQDAGLEEVVKRAYFDAIVGIGRRCRGVLSALLGDDDRIDRLFDNAKSSWSANRIRNAILHDGLSALEIERACDVRKRCRLVESVLREVIVRILRRAYGGCQLPRRPQRQSLLLAPASLIACSPGGGFQVTGDFSISMLSLLQRNLL